MKKLTLSLAVLAVAGVASAGLVPNGDFELGNTGWAESAGGGAATFSYPTTGGNSGGYGQIEEAGGWAVLVNPSLPGVDGGGVPLADLDITTGANTWSIDLINIAGTDPGGMKVEAWGANALLGNSGDVKAPAATASWTTFEFDFTLPAGTDKVIFVPLWGANSTVGFDNVGVVSTIPEPATMGLLGVAGGAMLFLRRRMRT